MNNIQNTICFEGFRIDKNCIDGFKEYISNFKYAYIGYDGDYHGPWIVSNSNDKFHEGMILEIKADGIEISGEFKANRPPKMDSLTANWKELVMNWVLKSKEDWLICECDDNLKQT